MTNNNKEKGFRRNRRKKKVKAKIGTSVMRPRLSVFRSLKHIYAQIIDDAKGITLVSAHDGELSKENSGKKNTAAAKEVGKLIAKKALDKKISQVVFDRGGLIYHGRIKALAEGAREGGLEF